MESEVIFVDSNDLNLTLIAEYNGVVLSEEDCFIIYKFSELKNKICTELESNKPTPPSYNFEPVPSRCTTRGPSMPNN